MKGEKKKKRKVFLSLQPSKHGISLLFIYDEVAHMLSWAHQSENELPRWPSYALWASMLFVGLCLTDSILKDLFQLHAHPNKKQ